MHTEIRVEREKPDELADKLPYAGPVLTCYGTVRNLTRAGPSFTIESGTPALCVPTANSHASVCD